MSDQDLNLGHLAEEFAKLLVDVPQSAATEETIRLEEGERREVTILFLDLVGYTRLAERLDPEQLKFVVSNTLQVFTNQVKKFGGTVEKFVGDAIMAVFGRAQAYEDDSRRAVASAHAILDRLEDINSILAQRGIKLHARIGVNRGLIVTGQLAEHETITGEAINIAQRLEANAPEDGILISDAVYKDCGAYYRCEELPPLMVKNKTEPLTVYRVWEERESPATTVRAGLGPFVGRDGELAMMCAVAERARHQMSIIQITGEAGIGKSRLAQEFLHRFAQQSQPMPRSVYLAADSFGQAPYHLLSDLLREYLEQAGSDLSAFLQAIPDEEMRAGLRDYQLYLHDLLGLPLTSDQQAALEVMEPRARQAETLLALKRFLAAAAAREEAAGALPLIVVVDNQQWVAHASRDAVGQILQMLPATLPLCWVFVGRPTEVGQWLPANLSVTTLNLTSLTLETIEDLLRTRLPDRELTTGFCRQVLERTGGNPLFLGEVITALSQMGDISQFSLEEILPGSIKSLVLSRLDQLPKHQKFGLQVACVAGREFSMPLLTHILQRVGSPFQAPQLIQELLENGSIAPASTDGTYAIAQPMVADVTYTMILHANRRKLHGLVAQWAEELYHEHLTLHAAYLAEQWARAEETAKALGYYIEAGFAAKIQYAHHDGVSIFERALQLIKQGRASAEPEQIGLIYVMLVRMYEALSNFDAQDRLIMEALATLPEGSWSRIQLQLHAIYLRYLRGDADAAAAKLAPFAGQSLLAQYPDIQIDCYVLQGLLAWEHGEDAQAFIDAAVQLRPIVEARAQKGDESNVHDRYRRKFDRDVLYKIDYNVFNHYKNVNDLKNAEAYFDRVLEARQDANPFYQHMSHLFYCSLMWDRGVMFKRIAQRAGQARAYFREIGWARGVGWGAFYRAAACWRMGDFAEARRTCTETLQYLERVHDTYIIGKLELLLAAILLAYGDEVGYQLRKKRILGKLEGGNDAARLPLQREFAVFEGLYARQRHELVTCYEDLLETAAAPLAKVEIDEYSVVVALVAAQLGHAAEATSKLAAVRAVIERNEKKWLMGLMARVDGLLAAARRDVEAMHRAFGLSVIYLQEVGAHYDCHLSYARWWETLEQLGLNQGPKAQEVRQGMEMWEHGPVQFA